MGYSASQKVQEHPSHASNGRASLRDRVVGAEADPVGNWTVLLHLLAQKALGLE